MNLRLVGALALGFGMTLATVSPAAAENVPLERSGNVYHKAVCSHVTPRGFARCVAVAVQGSSGQGWRG